MATQPVGLGLVGAGGTFGTFIQSALRDVEHGHLAAIVDINEQALAEAKRKLGVERAYTNWRDLLRDDAIRVVIVASPPFTQAEIARAVIESGRALFLEKPGAIRLEDLHGVVDLQRAKKARATVDYVMRWNKLLDVVRQVHANGWLGPLRSVQFVNYAQDEVLPPKHWFWDREKSGGIFVEHSVHFFDLYAALAGSPPKEVASARTVRNEPPPSGRVDQVEAVVAHDNGVLCSYFHAFNRPKMMERQQAILAFDHGFLTVHGWIADDLELDGWVDKGTADALRALPHVTSAKSAPIGQELHGRDHDWRADERVTLRFGLDWDRNESYRREVAAGLNDLIASLDDPGYRQRVTLTDALRSLAVACVAAGTATIDEARVIYARYQPDGH